MSTLEKIEKIPVCPDLSGSETDLVKRAYHSDMISALLKSAEGREKITGLITAWLEKAVLYSGYSKNTDANQDRLLMTGFVNVIRKHQMISIDELDQVIQDGILGEYNDDNAKQWLNPTNLKIWLKKYVEGKRREVMSKQARYLQDREEQKEESQKQSDIEESKRENRRRFIEAYQAFEEDLKDKIQDLSLSEDDIPECLDHPSKFWYKRFSQAGLIDLDNAEKQAMYLEEYNNFENYRNLCDDDVRQIVRQKCMSKVFRRKIAELMLSETDIEQLIKDYEV